MRRHAALQDLSRDHHNVLVHARRLRGLDARFDAATARERFLRYAETVLLHHFAEEEAALPTHVDAALRDRLLLEHADLRARVVRLPTASDDEQRELGERLRLHVRFEEDLLFTALQQLDERTLVAVCHELAAFRGRVRPDGAGESCFL